MTEGTVLHADLDSFFASVEQRDDPSLRGRPVIVGGGVVLACSYEAKAKGVRTAMGGRQASRLCPEAVVVSPRMDAYTQASRDVFDGYFTGAKVSFRWRDGEVYNLVLARNRTTTLNLQPGELELVVKRLHEELVKASAGE